MDEAQNLTPKQAKGIITRAGMGTKIILLGDPQQIDHPLLDERTNGLSYAAEKMKAVRCAGRSPCPPKSVSVPHWLWMR